MANVNDMNWSEMNKRLFELYSRLWPQIEAVAAQDPRNYWPHLMWVNENYVKSRLKLLFVGKEALQWGGRELGLFCRGRQNAVEELMRINCQFDNGGNYVRSPFWRACCEIQQLVNPGSPRRGFLWSNLVKIDCGERPRPDVEDAISRLLVLPQEIDIVKPDAVIFFTGTNYDDRLRATFKGVRYADIQGFGSREMALLEHELLPEACVRTYHPGFIQRTGRFDEFVQAICRVIEYRSNRET